jgi:predicted RNA binding protein YcfA (HicA-like mRNA interferase family)
MKIPRDISGKDFVIRLKKYGYDVSRQSSSHIRLTTTLSGTHHITIPNHSSLRKGTISAILNDVANHLHIDKNDLIINLFS